MELYKKVRLACSEGMSARAAAKHFNISRGTVEKMLAFSVPSGYRREKPIKRPKLDGFTEIIDAWLEADKAVHRKQRHTAKRIFERLQAEHGFTGGYTIIKDYVREHERRSREMFVPLAKTGAELLFEMISQRYERGATLITRNLPFEEWTETFGTERLTGALLDRLTHHVKILEMNGESYRLAQSRARKAADIN